MISETYFGRQKAVFANQDDGIFSAIPITFDESVLTLETYTEGVRKFVRSGSLVKQGTTIKGITAEEYEITDGPVNGRVVLEGYVYVEYLTQDAVESLSLLPKIVPIPYGKIVFAKTRESGLDVYIKVSGSVFTSAVAATHFTISDTDTTNAEIKTVTRSTSDNSYVKLTFGAKSSTTLSDGSLSITAINSAAVVGSSGKVIAGLPITITFKDGEVCVDA